MKHFPIKASLFERADCLSYHIFQLHLNLSVDLGHLKQGVSCEEQHSKNTLLDLFVSPLTSAAVSMHL